MTSKVDSERRVTLPQANPGDVFKIEEQGIDRLVLTRVRQPPKRKKLSREEVREALEKWDVKFNMTWDELRAMTRGE
jgi:hypothetical protein